MIRRYEFQMYPNKAQKMALEETCDICKSVYNWGLRQRIWLYEEWQASRSHFQQCADLTVMRALKSEWQGVHTHALQITLKRLDFAFQRFFENIKSGKPSGFPRFKSKNRDFGFGYKEHKNGWTFINERRLKLNPIGEVRIRGRAKYLGTPKTCDIIKKAGKWFVSITFDIKDIQRPHGHLVSGLDWGVSSFATLANNDNTIEVIENPKHLRKSLKILKIRAAQLSRARKTSRRREINKRKLGRLHSKIANQRKNFLHQTSSNLIATRSVIGIERLNINSMVESSSSSHLTREILASSGGAFHQILKYKAEEAGVEIIEIDPKIHKPTQTDCKTGEIKRKSLKERIHYFNDGTFISRDENAARNLLKLALGTSVKLGGQCKLTSEETESIAQAWTR